MKGSCLCGAVTYEVDELSTGVAHCHCHTCRKAHAAPYAAAAGADRAAFRWLSGRDWLTAFESSPGKRRWFCSGCGAHLIAEREGQAHVIVRVATLDEDPGVRPQAHIWCAHERPWLAADADVPSYPEWPPGR